MSKFCYFRHHILIVVGPISISAALLGASISNNKISLLFTKPLFHALDRLLSIVKTL